VNSTGEPDVAITIARTGAGERDGYDSPSLRRVAIFRSMPLPDFTPEEYAEIVRLVRSAIEGDRYPLSARVRRLRSILHKLEPPAPKPIPFPAPKPAGTPSLVYAKLRGGRGRRYRNMSDDIETRPDLTTGEP
jgi:hypothetical protein